MSADKVKETITSIVCMDDDPSTSRLAKEALVDYPSEVISCHSSEALSQILAGQKVDVVILAATKPLQTTFDLLGKIREKPETPEIVFVSEFDEATVWIEAIQRGAYE